MECEIATATNSANRVAGNRIGTNPAGTADLGNGGIGVLIHGSRNGNIVGGATAVWAT